MTVFTFSRVPAFNPNTTPVSVARSATGNVYDIGDTGFTTPLNLTLVATNTVTTSLVSDANGMFPDFTLVDRTSVVFKSGSSMMVLTTTTPIPGPTGPASTVPGPAGPATTDASLLTAGTLADARLPARLAEVELNATYLDKTSGLSKTEAAATYELLTKPATVLPTWVRKRVLNQLSQSPVRILCVGDSTAAGVYSDSYTTAIGTTNQGGPNSYPAQLAKRLTAAGIPAEHSFCLPGRAGNADSRWALGTWNYAGGTLGAGAAGAITATAAGAGAVVTPGVVADRYTIYYFGDPGTGTFTALATGGVSTSVNTSQATGGIYKTTISAGAASAANTLTLTWGAGTVFVLGVEAYDSANPNKIRVLGAGVGGSKATDWSSAAATDLYGGRAFIKALAPDLTIISLGVNDGAVPATTASVLAAVQQLATDAKISGDALLMSAVPHGNASTLDGYNAAYKTAGYPYVDLQARWGYAGQTLQFLTTDNTHPNAIGYGDMATAVAQHLLSA